METIDADNFENLINDKLDLIIYIGSADCHYCIVMINDIQELLKKERGKIFYWNVDLYNDFFDERILALFDSLGIEPCNGRGFFKEREKDTYIFYIIHLWY